MGGITIAQKPDTAGQPDMPGSAIASGCIDFVLSPEDIAEEIAQIAQAVSRGVKEDRQGGAKGTAKDAAAETETGVLHLGRFDLTSQSFQ